MTRAVALLSVLAILGIAATFVSKLLDPGLNGPERCIFTDAHGTTFELTPDQARNAATIAAVATRRGMPTRAAVIGIATAMQESKLRNLSGGDRDSLGLFQQRPSQGWGNADQIRDPVYASTRFYDELAKVPDWQEIPLTKAAQKVQRSGFPEAYAQHETEATLYADALDGERPQGIGCRLKDPVGGPSPTQVKSILERETGLAAEITDNTLVVTAQNQRPAATAAAWAVASAASMGVAEVKLGASIWRRGADEDSARWSESGDTSAATSVRIVLAPRS
ncbi:hypothetical protein KEM60_02134 [Austwickia sp. TVS 96-490-7B]|uniref:hypothetical protein n=1 Tax=Austwickia sp. TVS 96-490-7B TaxID=2830843 RepID=UPI001C574B1F|nr:hypothetical protein [Austwickia sp. TVS 96-490-7B]MBW3085923.1 hypothetical protein [Austwickia sp. TVS 96-490-7B]